MNNKMLQGLIPGVQTNINLATDSWEFGTIINNQKIIDSGIGQGCFTLGFKRHDIIDYVCSKLKTYKPECAESLIGNTDEILLNDVSFELSQKLYDISGGYKSFYSLSGSDANEGAIKLASAYHYKKGNNFKHKIVSFKNSYHGSTFLNYNLGDSLFENPFYSLLPYAHTIRLDKNFELGDTDWTQVAAIIVETRSWSNWLKKEPIDFWNKLEQIRYTFDVLIIIDDIFMGGGKTGEVIGWKSLDIKPDIFTLGKSITAGYFPLSITLYNDKVNAILPKDFNWDHGFTYSFSLPGILSTLKYLDILEKEDIFSNFKTLQHKTESVINTTNFLIKNQFGLVYNITNGKQNFLYIIPLNATDEYFSILKNTLDKYL